jgi:hypothetical protein
MSNVMHTVPSQPVKPPHVLVRLVCTIAPFVVVVLGRFILLPSYHAPTEGKIRDWSDANNIVALGIFPWLMSAVIIEIVVFIIAGVRHVKRQEYAEPAVLRRVNNVVGTAIAVLFGAWILFDLTHKLSLGMIDPNAGYALGKPRVDSPLPAFAALMGGTFGLKLLFDVLIPRSFLDQGSRILAGAWLIVNLHVLSGEVISASFWDVMDILRILVNLLKCGVLLACVFIGPTFVWRQNNA